MERYYTKLRDDGTWGVYDRQTGLPFAWFAEMQKAKAYCYFENYRRVYDGTSRRPVASK